MQDRETGQLVAATEEQCEQALQDFASGKLKQPPVIIRKGDVFNLSGGLFRVKTIGRKFLTLEGLPGTYTSQEEGE